MSRPRPPRLPHPARPLFATLVLVVALAAPAAAETPAEAPEGTEGAGPALHQGEAPEPHGEGHGGGHGVTHLDNWFSFSFGPGKAHQNGPFAIAILNFIILVYLAWRFGRRPIAAYLESRHSSIRDSLAEAARLRAEAQSQLDEIKGRLRNLEQEIAGIKQRVAADAEQEKQRIIADAQSQAESLVQAADRALERELVRVRRLLEAEAVSAAMEAAEKLIKQQINEADRRRIDEDYLTEIGSRGGKN